MPFTVFVRPYSKNHGPLKRTKFNYELRSADLNWVVKMSIEQECIESRYDRKIWTDQSRVDSDSKGIESDVSLGSDLQEMEIYKEVHIIYISLWGVYVFDVQEKIWLLSNQLR